MKYEIEFHANGCMMRKFYVPAVKRGVIGNYHGGVPYGPCEESVIAGLPYYVRKAAERSVGFWSTNMSDVQRMDLNRAKDFAAMGSVFATLVTTGKES